MRNNEVLDRLQNLINYMPLQKELVEKTGINQSTLSSKLSRNSNWSEKEIEKLNKAYNIDILKNTTHNIAISRTVKIDYYPDVIASCGNGTYQMSQNCIKYDVPTNFLPDSRGVKSYSMCHAKGNSMFPRIWDGDFVICEHKENMRIENGEMYIFCYDEQLYLKRLSKNINQIVVESENPDFPTQYIEKDQMNDVHLIGHVICSGRMNGKYLDKRV